MRTIKYLLIGLSAALGTLNLSGKSFEERLSELPSVKKVTRLENNRFPDKFLILFEQPIDHKDPSAGTFTQRVFVGHIDTDSATVLVTEGYVGSYAMRAGYRDEISALFNTNNVLVEHRYFAESTPYPGADPSDIEWKHLTAENAANDLHRIFVELKSLYPGKWISTGISKGGQNTMIYRTFFPDDMDFSVPYVGPLCRSASDGRHEPFIAEYVGTPEERERVKNFQIEFLKRKKSILPLYDSLCKANGYKYNIPTDQVYDYTMLEFSFAFWQWGYDTSAIPDSKASDREIFDYMMKLNSPEYFQNWSATSPFFVQAAKELGYYGYDMKPFRKYKKYFSIDNTKDYLHKIMLPKGLKFTFDDTLYHKISAFLLSTDAKMLFIYGQFDPWSAVMPGDPHKENLKFFIEPGGSHRARIATFDKETRKEITEILSEWLYN